MAEPPDPHPGAVSSSLPQQAGCAALPLWLSSIINRRTNPGCLVPHKMVINRSLHPLAFVTSSFGPWLLGMQKSAGSQTVVGILRAWRTPAAEFDKAMSPSSTFSFSIPSILPPACGERKSSASSLPRRLEISFMARLCGMAKAPAAGAYSHRLWKGRETRHQAGRSGAALRLALLWAAVRGFYHTTPPFFNFMVQRVKPLRDANIVCKCWYPPPTPVPC